MCMTERINVSAKTRFNRLHAFLALVFWIIAGYFVGYFLTKKMYCDLEWVGLVAGIIIGIIRMFVINDKYAWQIATLEEIRDIKAMLEPEEKKESEEN